MEERDAHVLACEAGGKARFLAAVERPRSWAYGIGIVREIMAPAKEDGTPSQRKFFVGVTENVVTRAQLVAYRNLISLALEESPDPLPVTPVPA